MKRSLSIIFIVALALVLVFSQAFASSTSYKPKPTPQPKQDGQVTESEQDEQGQPNEKGGKPDKANQHAGRKYNFKGEVTAFDGSTLELNTKKGGTVQVLVDANTEIKVSGPDQEGVQIETQQQVMVQATKTEKGVYQALRVHIMPNKAQRVHRVGTVTAYEAGKSITVEDAKGASTFEIAKDVKILPAERAGELQVGSRVTIICPRDPSGETLTATGIVVHPQK